MFYYFLIRFSEVSENYVYGSIRSTLSRRRSSTKPKIFQSIAELGTVLTDIVCFKAVVKSKNNKSAVIFPTDDLLTALSESDQ